MSYNINTQRMIDYIKQQLSNLLLNHTFEANDEITRFRISAVVGQFLQPLVYDHSISDFRIVCDESNNPPDADNINELLLSVFLRPGFSTNIIEIRCKIFPTESFTPTSNKQPAFERAMTAVFEY